jgi:hypothetical protein
MSDSTIPWPLAGKSWLFRTVCGSRLGQASTLSSANRLHFACSGDTSAKRTFALIRSFADSEFFLLIKFN